MKNLLFRLSTTTRGGLCPPGTNTTTSNNQGAKPVIRKRIIRRIYLGYPPEVCKNVFFRSLAVHEPNIRRISSGWTSRPTKKIVPYLHLMYPWSQIFFSFPLYDEPWNVVFLGLVIFIGKQIARKVSAPHTCQFVMGRSKFSRTSRVIKSIAPQPA